MGGFGRGGGQCLAIHKQYCSELGGGSEVSSQSSVIGSGL